jgi:DNA-binding CsgD family transcriptional regulator
VRSNWAARAERSHRSCSRVVASSACSTRHRSTGCSRPSADRLRPHIIRQGDRRSIDIVEPLTAKELEVLARLPSHATYRAIGAQLYVSVNTVKTYVRSVYRKLGVSSRAEAVEVARRCGLLDQ